MLNTGEMLKMLNLLSQKVLKTGKMLHMLKMLKFIGRTSDVKVGILKVSPNNLNIFNNSPVLSVPFFCSKTRSNIFNFLLLLFSALFGNICLKQGNFKDVEHCWG